MNKVCEDKVRSGSKICLPIISTGDIFFFWSIYLFPSSFLFIHLWLCWVFDAFSGCGEQGHYSLDAVLGLHMVPW